MAETTCSTCAAVLDVPVGSSAMDAQIAHVLAEHPQGLCIDGPITCPRPEECGICPAADRYRAKACSDDRHPVSVSSGSCPCGRFRIAGSDVAERLVDRVVDDDWMRSLQARADAERQEWRGVCDDVGDTYEFGPADRAP